MKTRRFLLLCVWLPLVLGIAACETEFGFRNPNSGIVTVRHRFPFTLNVPPGTQVSDITILLDEVEVPTAGWRRPIALRPGADRIRGSLRDVAKGSHALRAVLTPPTGPVLEDEILFEMADRARFDVRESVEQLHVTRALPDQPAALIDRWGNEVAAGTTDAQGSLVLRLVAPDWGYRVVVGAGAREASPRVRVWSEAESLPPQSFYAAQVLEPGYGYIETRDGTKLSVYVSLPGPVEDGPYPTLVNYSGYDPSRPGSPVDLPQAVLDQICPVIPVLCDAPDHPSGLVLGTLGFATVGVNMRGTACSGGAYDYFEPLQLLDGYDAIETIARQEWVLHNEVGMAGLSYPGISQLFVASTRPPSLAAITPLSVIAMTSDSITSPGGILNNGFALEWGQQVVDRADPFGHGWEQDQVDAGDTICEENQLLHSQKADIIQRARDFPYYVPEVYDPVNPVSFVGQIEVPVFTAGGWQDEQTGGHFSTLWDLFEGSPAVRYTGYNGAHADGYTPHIVVELKNFLDLYVRRAIEPISQTVRSAGPALFADIFGFSPLPPERLTGFASYEEALAAYEAEPPVRIIFEVGAPTDMSGNIGPGSPIGAFELGFDEWPPEEIAPERWYFNADGSLRDFPPTDLDPSGSSFAHDAAKGQETYEVDSAFEAQIPDIVWAPWQADRQVVFVSDPLAETKVMVGPASGDLYLRSTAVDADLEVLVSEVRPDGQETLVQSGWLRASRRLLAPHASPLRPVHTNLESDELLLPPNDWVLARVEIFPFAHVFRAGSRIRVSVSSPGGNRGRWRFETLEFAAEEVRHAISHSAQFPSSILFPVIPGVEVESPLPPVPSLRAQPSRDYAPHTNAPHTP